MHNKAAFFDRDGTIIKDVSYLSRLDQIEIIPQAVQIARTYQQQGYKLFVVTNQSGIARGFFDEAFVQATHEHLQTLFAAQGVFFHKWYYCPHHPTAAVTEQYKKLCVCRKPQPGMLLQAAREFELDLCQSVLFGDKQCDFDAGTAAGVKVFDITAI